MTGAHQKGKSLEMAVHALESAILRRSPGYNEKTFHIAGRKIISMAGVHHEIDIWVNVEIGDGYSATFIFECKNQKAKVGKNDIVAFAEKIKAAQAQTGFFVAKSFTRDAKAQASVEPRIQLLCVRQLPIDEVPLPIQCFHAIVVESREIKCCVEHGSEYGTATIVDLSTASFTIEGETLDLSAYLNEWSNEEISKRQDRFRSESVAEGVYPLAFEASRVFSDRDVMMNHERVAQMTLSGAVQVRVVRGTIVSRFEVETRGRIFRCSVELPNGGNISMDQSAVVPRPSVHAARR
jgi:hypothetical protein